MKAHDIKYDTDKEMRIRQMMEIRDKTDQKLGRGIRRFGDCGEDAIIGL